MITPITQCTPDLGSCRASVRPLSSGRAVARMKYSATVSSSRRKSRKASWVEAVLGRATSAASVLLENIFLLIQSLL